MTVTRTLVAAFAAATLAAPTALARPVDTPVPQVRPVDPTAYHAPPSPVAQHDDGTSLATIGLGVAGGVILVGTITGITTRGRRPQRRRVAA